MNLGGQVIQNYTETSNQYDNNYWSALVNNGGALKLNAPELGGSPVVFTEEVDEVGKISTSGCKHLI